MCQRDGTVLKATATAVLLALQWAAAPAAAWQAAAAPLGARSFSAAAESTCRGAGCSHSPQPRHLVFGSATGVGATLVELESNDPPGQYRRPRYALGVRSQALESALDTVGLDAHRCLAPMVRMNTKLSASLNLSGTLWIYLRCSLN